LIWPRPTGWGFGFSATGAGAGFGLSCAQPDNAAAQAIMQTARVIPDMCFILIMTDSGKKLM
jgi:hypothetical protein